MADASRVLFRDNESELEEHEAPRWTKLKRADEPFNPDLDLQGDISGEDSTDQDHAGDQADLCKESPHVIFSVPPDILQSHESTRNSQLKIADDMYLNIGDVMSPHVSFLGPEVVLREHELPRPTSYKKGDEPPTPCTVEVAPYRALFQTPEDLLHAHDLPRAPALKMADEVFVQPETLSPDTVSPAHSPREHHTEENRFQCDQKSRVPSFWHNNLVAGALRTLSMACPITDVEREQRVTAVKGSYTHIVERQPNPYVSLSRLEETLLRVESMRMVHQVTTALLRDLSTALHLAGEDDTLKQEDFTALLLTLGALSNQRAFLDMLSDVQCRILRPPSPPMVHNMCVSHRNRRVNLDQMSETSTCSHPSQCSDLDGPCKGV